MSESFVKKVDKYDNGCKVCPICKDCCHPFPEQNLKMCSNRKNCGWQDNDWRRDKDQPPIHG